MDAVIWDYVLDTSCKLSIVRVGLRDTCIALVFWVSMLDSDRHGYIASYVYIYAVRCHEPHNHVFMISLANLLLALILGP